MIGDPSEFTAFSDFANTGIITTDTFNLWRKKDNGIIEQLNLFEANSASTGIDVNNTTATISIKTGGVLTANIADLAVTNDKISNLTITGAKLAAAAVTESKIGAAAVTESKIGVAAVTEEKISSSAVTSVKINNLAVTESKIGAGAVTESKIGLAAVTESKIGAGAVTESKIGLAAVTESKIVAGAVSTDKIANIAITSDKLAAASVTESKIGAGAVSTDKIANLSISASKLTGGQLGTAPVFGARAFGAYNGTTGTLYTQRGNIASIAYSGPGTYLITMQTPMPNTEYAVVANATHKTSVTFGTNCYVTIYSTTQFAISTGAIIGGGYNSPYVSFCVYA